MKELVELLGVFAQIVGTSEEDLLAGLRQFSNDISNDISTKVWSV